MKKLFAITILALAASSASAQLVGYIDYNYDRSNGSNPSVSHNEFVAGVRMPTKIGAFDGNIINRNVHGNDGVATGAEVGYSNFIKLKEVTVTGRAAYGQQDFYKYYTLGVNTLLPVKDKLAFFADYRYKHGISKETPSAENKVALGVNYDFDKNISGHLGVARTTAETVAYNGVVSGLAMKF